MSGVLTNLLAVTACGAVVVVAEPVTIPLLRRAAFIDVPGHRSSHTVPTRAAAASRSSGLLVAAVLIGGALATVFACAVAAFGLLGFADDMRGLTRACGWPRRPPAAPWSPWSWSAACRDRSPSWCPRSPSVRSGSPDS